VLYSATDATAPHDHAAPDSGLQSLDGRALVETLHATRAMLWRTRGHPMRGPDGEALLRGRIDQTLRRVGEALPVCAGPPGHADSGEREMPPVDESAGEIEAHEALYLASVATEPAVVLDLLTRAVPRSEAKRRYTRYGAIWSPALVRFMVAPDADRQEVQSYALATNPHVQGAALAELRDLVGEDLTHGDRMTRSRHGQTMLHFASTGALPETHPIVAALRRDLSSDGTDDYATAQSRTTALNVLVRLPGTTAAELQQGMVGLKGGADGALIPVVQHRNATPAIWHQALSLPAPPLESLTMNPRALADPGVQRLLLNWQFTGTLDTKRETVFGRLLRALNGESFREAARAYMVYNAHEAARALLRLPKKKHRWLVEEDLTPLLTSAHQPIRMLGIQLAASIGVHAPTVTRTGAVRGPKGA
jgi:hypothetical protein